MRHAARVRAPLAALALAACSSSAPDAVSAAARSSEAGFHHVSVERLDVVP